MEYVGWILGLLWAAIMWLVTYVATYLLAPIFFIVGWAGVIAIVLFVLWAIRFGPVIAVKRMAYVISSVAQWSWNTGRRVVYFIRGVQAVQLPGESAQTAERVKWVKKPMKKRITAFARTILLGVAIDRMIVHWDQVGPYFHLLKEQIIKVWT